MFCRGIALDPCENYIFFTDWNEANPTVQRALFSGLQLKTLVSKNIRVPNAIAVDFSSKFLYWSDARLDTIERCDYEGGQRFIISQGLPSHAFGISIFGDSLYCKPKFHKNSKSQNFQKIAKPEKFFLGKILKF